ncbi:MAG: ATP-binding cassette domain-containing protein [Gammaproteobacteria bacterium]|nr:ATP-binding cassette domain-containing protein [Gammaproteobacteria bacterium]
MALLSIKNLQVKFRTNDGFVNAVNDVSFEISAGGKLALVGESGSGKSQIAFAIMGLLARNGEASGAVEFNGQNLLEIKTGALNRIRSKEIAIIFQDPMSSLNPYMRIERQLDEVLELHEGLKGNAVRKRVLEVMDAVQISDAVNRLRCYPHEFSGGMRQRIVIAMALLCNPKLILADEPTTALDVTVQAQIMSLLNDIQRDCGTAILLITHDLGVVAGFSDETMVLYGGRVMERASTLEIFDHPGHPYTRGLLRAVPNIHERQDKLISIAGSPPGQHAFPAFCPFAPRCPDVVDACFEGLPELSGSAPIRACFRPVQELS